MRRFLTGLTALALLAAACGSDDSSSVGPEEPIDPATTTSQGEGGGGLETIRSDVDRADPSGVPAADIAAVARADAQLGLDLLRLAGAGGDNTFLSPYSIATALAMLLPGANGATESEIAALLGATDEATYHPARGALDAAVTSPAELMEGVEGDPFVLRAANQLFGQQGHPFLDDYLDTLARYYGAPLVTVDYVADPEGSRELINGWVAEQTENRIEDLIPPDVLDALTRLVLVNAVYFSASWLEPFSPGDTAPESFTDLDGAAGPVPMMRTSTTTAYAAGDDYQAVRLPYADQTTSMLVIVPDEGAFADVVAGLDADKLAAIRETLSRHQVELGLPSFEFETSVSLSATLQALGMVEAFDANAADLTGITDAEQLYVKDALHKAFVSVDEQGTEAAAATALIVSATSAPPMAELTVDRPFVFVIQHDETGEMLFVGQVTQLAGTA